MLSFLPPCSRQPAVVQIRLSGRCADGDILVELPCGGYSYLGEDALYLASAMWRFAA